MEELSNSSNFFSGNHTEKEGVSVRTARQEFYCEGQSANNYNIHEGEEEEARLEKEARRFFAIYNRFF
jgi:hypothetical protein